MFTITFQKVKIKNLLLAASGLVVAAGAVSCSDISESERLIPVELEKAQRMVLLEEFTGQNCTNCPEGHEIVHNLLHAYPNGVIPVSIHASTLSIPESQGGLAIAEGAEYFLHYNQPSLPSGVVNRSSGVKDRSEWAGEISSIVSVATPLSIRINAEADDDGNIAIDVDRASLQALAGNLQIWITEDHVLNYQNDHGMVNWDYEHNHVLRGVVNGVWGEPVSLEPFQMHSGHYTIAAKPSWVVDNLTVVAFYYNDGGVVNAMRFNLNGDNPETPVLPGEDMEEEE